MKTAFFRVVDTSDKARALLSATSGNSRRSRIDIDPAVFSEVPGSPFAYGLSAAFRAKFRTLQLFEANGRLARQGMASSDDFRFVRLWFEIPCTGPETEWVSYAKGGERSGLYADLDCVVNWKIFRQRAKSICGDYTGNLALVSPLE